MISGAIDHHRIITEPSCSGLQRCAEQAAFAASASTLRNHRAGMRWLHGSSYELFEDLILLSAHRSNLFSSKAEQSPSD